MLEWKFRLVILLALAGIGRRSPREFRRRSYNFSW